MTSWAYTFVAEPGARVVDGEISFDVAAPYVGTVSRLSIHNLNTDGLNVRKAILAHPVGTTIYVQDRADAAIYATLVVTAPAVEAKGYLDVPVGCVEASPEGLTAGPVELFFLPVSAAVIAVRSAETDPLLVTLTVAKDHLRILDTAHDADLTQKMTAASATIRDYLKDRNDPTWSAATVPPWIQAAVLLLLAHQYEHRGDEFGPSNDNDDRVWTAIENLCRRSRDPALA